MADYTFESLQCPSCGSSMHTNHVQTGLDVRLVMKCNSETESIPNCQKKLIIIDPNENYDYKITAEESK